MRLDDRSEERMQGVSPQLVMVARRAAEILAAGGTGLGFIVTEGLRTKARQADLVKAGASQTLNSRHLVGQAIDVAAVVGKDVRWDWPLYPRIAAAWKQAAREQGVVITWGGDWPRFRDGPHFQIEPGKALT